jgi:two-component system chemotaxis response regulator CheY
VEVFKMAKRILVVDDSSAIRQSVSFILEQAGYEVNCADDGLAGLQLASKSPFDLVLTDVNMPNLDGIGFTRKLRELPQHKFTPIIVLTTESQGSRMEEGKAAGATGWIVKPFETEKLLAVVKKLIS